MNVKLSLCILLALLLIFNLNKAKAQVNILFCGGVENDKPIGVSDRFYPDSANTYIYAYYSQQTPLEVKQVIMQIYKKNDNSFEKTGERQQFITKPKWKYTYLKCYFNSPGLYKVQLYDGNEKLLAEGLVTIM